MSWHSSDSHDAVSKLASSLHGLSQKEAEHRLEESGANELKETPRAGPLRMFFGQFEDFMILILIAAAVISALLGEYLDAGAIIAIVVLNAILGFVQEYRAEKAIAALKRMSAPQARVLRDGKERKIEARLLVPGDVVLLAEGDRVPADCRLIEAVALEADEAPLTGESLPVHKVSEAVPEKAPLAERKSMLFAGTAVTRGRGKAVVVETGMRTELGKIAQLVQDVQDDETPLKKRLEKMGKQLGIIALVICGVVFIAGFLRGEDALEMFLTSVSLAVAAIPEGLPAVVTITLAVGVQRMVKRKAIIRKLPAVETLGAATVICSDKTGTLTKNEMTVRELWFLNGSYHVTGAGYAPAGDFMRDGKKTDALKDKAAKLLIETGVLCNNASFEEGVVLGDPTESSLLVLAAKAGLGVEKSRRDNAFVSEIPFDSSRKMMTVVRKHGGKATAYTKGAAEVIVEKCAYVLKDGKETRITPALRREILEANKEMASKALRVLAFSVKTGAKDAEKGMTFVGLCGMNDPPRQEAKEAISLCKTAGIRVMMITGDNAETAKAVAHELGIPSEGVLTGPDIDALSEYEFDKAVGRTSVFARVSPEHKLRIVEALKKRGEIVAMTGDGVNDAPALKKADIGVGMGITGTDVSKEASDMIVTDDNFASIVSAVEEGRIVFDNVLKTVRYLISCNIGEVLTIFIAVIVGLKTPLLPIQILWMNLVTDSLPALALGMDPKDPDVMKRKPREPSENILNKRTLVSALSMGVLMAAGVLGVYLYTMPEGIEKARTMAFTTIIFFQFFYAFAVRSDRHSIFSIGAFSNKLLVAAIAFSALLQVAIIYLPFAQPIFKTSPLVAADFLLAIAVSSTALILPEMHKFMKRRGVIA
ncbi:Potassium-transporting ATPase ATP-binding subunit [Candidatus Norongarragalina meridionalis]|nr:Potassium-transporting ATPase ATP-binding subunit [Candidatus Norongarragalina meridionalis]